MRLRVCRKQSCSGNRRLFSGIHNPMFKLVAVFERYLRQLRVWDDNLARYGKWKIVMRSSDLRLQHSFSESLDNRAFLHKQMRPLKPRRYISQRLQALHNVLHSPLKPSQCAQCTQHSIHGGLGYMGCVLLELKFPEWAPATASPTAPQPSSSSISKRPVPARRGPWRVRCAANKSVSHLQGQLIIN